MADEKFDIKQVITNEIIESLETCKTLWHKDWKCMGVPISLSTKNYPYKGINFLILSLKQLVKNYKSCKWLTIKQCNKMGGQVLKGEKSTLVIYYQPLKVIDKNTNEEKTVPMLKYYRVFNIEQTTLQVEEDEELKELDNSLMNKDIETIINSYDCPIENQLQDRACYSPIFDSITMPMKEQFGNYHAYYATLLHEVAHSTGHTKRLDRFNETKKVFKSDKEDYAFEELVAELTSMFLLATYNIDNEAIKNNNISYIKQWLIALKNDKNYIFTASKFAQKAFEFVTKVNTNSSELKENTKELVIV